MTAICLLLTSMGRSSGRLARNRRDIEFGLYGSNEVALGVPGIVRRTEPCAARWPASGALVLLARGNISGNGTADKHHEAGDRGDPETRRRMDIRGQSGQQFEGVDMRRPDYGEMATVQRCKLRYPEPFASRHH